MKGKTNYIICICVRVNIVKEKANKLSIKVRLNLGVREIGFLHMTVVRRKTRNDLCTI